MPVALRVTPWPDPVLDVLGHDPRSWYAETFWLPTLGPTALLLMRHLADRFERTPEGVELPVADTAAALGLGAREGNSSPLMRSLSRLRQFELACTEDEITISVRRVLPPVHRRHVRRLPVALQAQHEEWMAGQRAAPVEVARRRAQRVALMLFVQGETMDSIERALHTAGFHPALAHEAVRWALARQHELDADTDAVPSSELAAENKQGADAQARTVDNDRTAVRGPELAAENKPGADAQARTVDNDRTAVRGPELAAENKSSLPATVPRR